MSRSKKLTNKQIENHLNNLYGAVKTESVPLTTIMKVISDFIEFSGKTKEFEGYLKELYPKPKEEVSDKPIGDSK